MNIWWLCWIQRQTTWPQDCCTCTKHLWCTTGYVCNRRDWPSSAYQWSDCWVQLNWTSSPYVHTQTHNTTSSHLPTHTNTQHYLLPSPYTHKHTTLPPPISLHTQTHNTTSSHLPTHTNTQHYLLPSPYTHKHTPLPPPISLPTHTNTQHYLLPSPHTHKHTTLPPPICSYVCCVKIRM